MFCTKVCRMNTVGPAISTISISRPASDRFSSDSRRTPLSSPVTTEMVASKVVATIRPICTGMVTGRP